MSAMNVWVTNDVIAITTDTYCHKKEYGIEFPLNFVSKIYQTPQFKSCFTNQGLRDLGMRYFEFIQNEVKAKDFETLIQYTGANFNIRNFYPDLPYDKIGTIFIFGLNETKQKFEVFKIYFDEFRKVVVEEICEHFDDCIMIFKPQHERLDLSEMAKNSDWTSLPNAIGSLVEVMKRQKEEDDLDDENVKVGIGGEIQMTLLSKNDGFFTIQTSIIYQFPDFEKLYLRMKLNI